MIVTDQILDFLYAILQRRLSTGRFLIKSGLTISCSFLGIGALAGSITFEGFTLTADSNSSPVLPLLINGLTSLGIIFLVVGLIIELYERINGEAASKNRAKSIDLRSLSQATAPNLSKAFPLLIESSGIHNDLHIIRENGEPLSKWLSRSTSSLESFANTHLAKMNQHEAEHPLALGAQAHVPHCFVLGFLIANRRLVNYFCWNRDINKSEKSRWINCRDKRTKGQTTEGQINIVQSSEILKPEQITKIGLSIEMSITSNPRRFMEEAGLDVVYQIGLENQTIGNLFSEREQVKIISEIRDLLNRKIFKEFQNLEELHITITGQASFIMRLGAEFNQNHFPKTIKVHHFENNHYPWSFCISPNRKSAQYSIFENATEEVL